MPRRALLLVLLVFSPLHAADDKRVEQIAQSVRKSVVVVTTPGRDGKRGGLGIVGGRKRTGLPVLCAFFWDLARRIVVFMGLR